MLIITDEIWIPISEFELTVTRSSGPGGQNVNKVNSKVILRWSVMQTSALPPDVRARFLARHASRLTIDGAIVIMSDRFRDQPRNREDCLEKLAALVREVAVPPKPRRKTRPTRGSQVRRAHGKRLRGATKKNRGRVRGDD